MKIKFLITALSIVFFTACNGGSKKSNPETGHDVTHANHQHTHDSESELKSFGVNAKVAASINEIVLGYLSIKNALANDNGSEAAKGGDSMVDAMGKLDKSLLTVKQKKVYEDVEDDVKEHAEHISKSGGNIKHQREHFDMLSKDIYEIVKSFDGGKTLYEDYCPMYNDGKGAIWLSETKEIKNPYYGSQMPTCGLIKEEIK